jgi:hypothetical protein
MSWRTRTIYDVDSVFISSIQRDFSDIRQSARRAVESVGMRPLMAETAGASPASPQRALLDLVGRADVFLLILGPRYSKPTEDEFDEARRLAKPILVLRQNTDAEADQEAFVERVAGGWRGGRLWGTFDDAGDVGFAVVQALTNLRSQATVNDLRPAAQERARELVASGRGASGSIARIAHAPLVAEPLLDAVVLSRADLGETVAALARGHRLVPQSVGIEARVSAAGVALHQSGGYGGEPLLTIGADGAVAASFSVAGDDQFGGMRVEPARLRDGIVAAGALARAAWERLDEREAVQQVAVAVAIPDAQHKVFGASTGRNSIQMGSFSMPNLIVVPDPPRVVRRAEIGSSDVAERLVAEVQRVFADAGAIDG